MVVILREAFGGDENNSAVIFFCQGFFAQEPGDGINIEGDKTPAAAMSFGQNLLVGGVYKAPIGVMVEAFDLSRGDTFSHQIGDSRPDMLIEQQLQVAEMCLCSSWGRLRLRAVKDTVSWRSSHSLRHSSGKASR